MDTSMPARLNAASTTFLMLLIVSSTAAAQLPAPSSPPHRRHHAVVYDPASKRVLVAGGQHLISNTQTPILDDLWSWDGNQWTRLASGTGVPMITHKLYADSNSLFAVLPRGLVATLQGGRWNAVVPDSVTRRESAAGAWDPLRKRFVTFGGLVGGRAYDTSGETWEFDGRVWMRMATGGPPAMFGAAMAYDVRRHVMVLFGGMDTTGRKLANTWEWNGANWTLVSTTGPSARFGAGIAYDAKRGETVVFGGVGSSNQKLNDTWRWDGKSWRMAQSSLAPAPRSEGYLAFDAARGVVVMFGGEGANPVPTLGDTWEWNGAQWKQMNLAGTSSAQAAPVARVAYGAHSVGFRTVCDTTGRANGAREQVLIWYPAQRLGASTPMRFSEYLAPSRARPCGGPVVTQEQRDSVIRVFARQLSAASGQRGESEPVGGRLFPNDSAPGIAAALAAATTRSYESAQPVAGNFPIVVFAPAGAIEQPVLMESLASHGFVVVSFPHTGSPPNGFPREGVESGPARDVTMAREFGRAIDVAVRFGNADGRRVAVIANGGFIPGAIWFHATTHRLSAMITMEGRVPGARLRSATASTIGFRSGAADTLPANFEREWKVPVLDWQTAGNQYTRGVLESFTSAERIRLDALVSHPALWAARRLVHPADTLANTANDVMSAYVLKFLQYALERRPGASEYFDRAPEANGVPAGFLAIQRVR